jgi:hypothetical protein
MKIRNPFKDYLLRWKDDVTTKEKLVWSFLIVFYHTHSLTYLYLVNEKILY